MFLTLERVLLKHLGWFVLFMKAKDWFALRWGRKRMDYERFAAQVRPAMPAMVRVAAALVGLPDAEDAAQEALVRAWQSWLADATRPVTRAWLLRITINVGLNWQKGHFGTQQRRTDSLDAAPAQTLAIPNAPGDEQHTAALDLRAAIGHLPEDLRLIVILRYYGWLDASEIAEAHGMPAATVRTRLRRALAQLRDRLHGADFPGEPLREGATDA